ncbi:MAG: hypothetical protein U0527_06110 [Candidatus Eisenbacteria bacterium]
MVARAACSRQGSAARHFLLFVATIALAAADVARAAPILRTSARAQVVREFARTFQKTQGLQGDYAVGLRVQSHLKTEMALATAAAALADPSLARSARRDLDWILHERFEPGGGFNWDGATNPNFFEVHQHWFLIASELIRQELGLSVEYQSEQRDAWYFLRGTNPAMADFYLDNQARHGAFFAYRDVQRSGLFQQQAPFKGSYEIGAALWSLALHRSSSWIDQPGEIASYLARLTAQASKSPYEFGWYAPAYGGWIRSLEWTGDHWEGFTQHDWKYALHMEEGALLYQILTGGEELAEATRGEVVSLLAHVEPRGEIAGMPDGFGSVIYEYGEALSVLALAVECYQYTEPELSAEALEKGRLVFDYVARTFPNYPSEDHAILLLGLARMFAALPDASGPSGSPSLLTTLNLQPGLHPTSLLLSPNPTSGALRVEYRVENGAAARLAIIDVTGRVQFQEELPRAVGTGALWWDGT